MSRFDYYRQSSSFGMFPPVIKWLLILNVAMFFIESLFGSLVFGAYSVESFMMEFLALNPIAPYSPMGESFFYPWQLITYQFMHGGLFHLFFNMFALWMFGMEFEQMWGSKRFLTYYLLSGIGAGILQIFISNAPTVGASGAIYGLLLAFGVTFPDRKIFMFPLFIPISAKYFVMIFAGIELLSGIYSSNSSVAHFAHLGGAATGYLLIKFGDKLKIFQTMDSLWSGILKLSNKKSSSGYNSGNYGTNYYSYTSQSSWRDSQRSNQASQQQSQTTSYYKKQYIIDGEEITQDKIDSILDKISASGYTSLTEREKYILNELSKRL